MENVYICNNERQKEHLKPRSKKTKKSEGGREILSKGSMGFEEYMLH